MWVEFPQAHHAHGPGVAHQLTNPTRKNAEPSKQALWKNLGEGSSLYVIPLNWQRHTNALKLRSMTYFSYGTQRSLLSSPTVALIIINALVFVLTLFGGDPVVYLLAQQGSLVLEGGMYWQLFTSMFVHFGFDHIILNMFGLYYFGRLNEAHFSRGQFLAIYFGAGFLGNVMSLFLLAPDIISGGASGAIFGLVGSYVAIARRAQHMGVALVYAVLIFIMSAGLGVNIVAHLFGLISGLALGLLFAPKPQSSTYSYSYTYTT
jgi:rhomboid protease GluP